ncbi:MAG: DNA translocase FtsK [Lachnospiraceae bacterium]|nr:DNA translocase FtsK [Lachnospiraceae bacterium]
MASNQGRKQSSTKRKSTNTNRNSTNQKRTQTKRNSGRSRTQSEPMDIAIRNEILLIALLALAIILFLCNFGVVGKIGNLVSDVMFGIFGLMAYIAPIIIFLAIAFGLSNMGNNIATRKLVAGAALFLLISMVCELFSAQLASVESYQMKDIYSRCSENHNGGGVIAGSLAYASYQFLGMVGTILAILVLGIICFVIVTEKSFIGGVTRQGRKVYERSVEDAAYRRERAAKRRSEMEERRAKEAELRRQKEEEKENEKILRMDKKVTGVMIDTALDKEKEKENFEKTRDDIHEITLNPSENEVSNEQAEREPVREKHSYHYIENESDAMDEIHISEDVQEEEYPVHPADAPVIHMDGRTMGGHGQADYGMEETAQEPVYEPLKPQNSYTTEMGNTMAATPGRERVMAVKSTQKDSLPVSSGIQPQAEPDKKIMKPYKFPPLNLLAKGKGKSGSDSGKELRETAARLQQTLQTFGVKVTVTDISQGPSVTRYELQPEQGVKVSKIVGLADDIKLNLAATDIRIEAPIPGKAAVGIEVPNKENTAVAFRDLVESKEFKEFPSNLAFAVGKDIGGQIVVTDIAKMPHMLIAGATGSGKSVCINTIIMGILYKAHPDDVKMIMVDPKVVELSVYNGIPHLLIPVVTDPKKAAAALHWGVAEMTERYKKFADYNVRDLKGYNKKVESMQAAGDPEAPQKLPQILIIVDELADLMMVSPGEVEESICRLAQLARACGIHLIIATQRPSVDVITGLIKANMPSRVAFAVSSGVDSRTILDMVGAEKLLGKGDMLFYPQGYPKPARIQGAFVSDKEVADVVDFLKNQAIGNVYSEDIEEKIKSMDTGAGGAGGVSESGAEYDQYFADAGRFIIEKDKASIGMLQRVFKIGFNRAARIMDQLCEAGVVGEEEGTKPRKVLMTAEEFERFVEETI